MNPGDRISTIKGIGAKTESHLARIGIYTVGDMAEHYPCLLYTSICRENILNLLDGTDCCL